VQDLTQQFQLADGSVVGRNHVGRGNVLTGRNSQDAFCISQEPDCIVAVVSDGCGSTPYAEFGARLLANMACRELRFVGRSGGVDELRLARAHSTISQHLISIEVMMLRDLDDARQFVHDHLLATIVACIVTPTMTTIVAIGDGCFAVNDRFCSLDSFDSRPPYLAYSLLPRHDGIREESYRFSIVAQLPTDQIQNLMIGTDGVEDLRDFSHKFLPGRKSKQLGPLQQYWTEDRYFDNPIAIDRQLHLANSEHKRFSPGLGRIETHQGLLPDDTTMVVMRRAR